MKKFSETLKGLVSFKTIAVLLLVASVVFFFLPMFSATTKIGISFIPQNYSACNYMIGNPSPVEPSWEHLWIALALILPIFAIILLAGEQSTGKSVVITVLLLGTLVTYIFMMINANKDYHDLIDVCVTKDLGSIANSTIAKEADPCLVTLGNTNIFGTFGKEAVTNAAVLSKAGIAAGEKVVSTMALFFVELAMLVCGLACSVLGILGKDTGKSLFR